MVSQYGKKYPGSGGARPFPPSGGVGWHPLPEGMLVEEPVLETTTEVRHPNFLCSLLGARERHVEVTRRVGTRMQKNYDAVQLRGSAGGA